MKQNGRGWRVLSLLVLVGSTVCGASEANISGPALTPEQTALLAKASSQEKFVVKTILQHPPLVQTYIQHMQQDPQLGSVPTSDEYLLGRVDFGRTFTS